MHKIFDHNLLKNVGGITAHCRTLEGSGCLFVRDFFGLLDSCCLLDSTPNEPLSQGSE